MSSLKIVLRKKSNKDGSRPLAIRITKNRASSFTFIGHSIEEKFWDAILQRVKKSHPNSTRLNNLLSKKIAEANEKLLELETEKNDVSSNAIKKGLTSAKQGTFFKQAEIYLQNLKKNGKFNRYSSDKPRIERFREFVINENISFAEITPQLLKQYKAYLKSTRNIVERTAVNHLVVIRTIYNQGIESNIVDAKYYPFGKGKVAIKFPDSVKIGLTSEEVKKIEELVFEENSPIETARDTWLVSFYFAGMRISDVLRLKWADLQNDRLYYSMGKNDKAGSLKISEKAALIFQKYCKIETAHGLIFPYLNTLDDLDDAFMVQSRITQRIKKINEYLENIASLAKINKKLTTHIARHTFGNISGDKISVQMLQKLYRHSSITTTMGYQANFIYKDADEALNSVINF